MPDPTSPASVLAHVEVGVVVQDRAATILFANPTAIALLGSTDREMLGSSSFDPRWQAVTRDGVPITGDQHPVPQAIRTGQPVRDTVLDVPSIRAAIVNDAHRLREAAQAGVVQEQRFDEEFRIAMPDGSWRWVRAQSHGTLVGADMLCHGLITDVTERRMLAEQLRASQRQELIGVLVSGIAHNFNNMLAAILPNLERVSQTAGGELRQEIADAYDASRSAADLVRHLMLLVRREELRAVEPVDVVGLVHDVMRMCRRTFDQRIALETTAPPSAMIVLGRRSELQQVILNLLINARDAVEDVAVPLIEVEAHPLPPAYVGVTVRDTGTGMTEEATRHVGQPFFTTKPQGKGTGLGVATALGIVGELGGELTWTSRPGAGTTFRLSLPLAPSQQAREPADAPTGRRRFAGQLVLVIDDEPLVRKTLARLLEGLGLTVLLADTGREGLEMLAAQRHRAGAAGSVDARDVGRRGAKPDRRPASVPAGLRRLGLGGRAGRAWGGAPRDSEAVHDARAGRRPGKRADA